MPVLSFYNNLLIIYSVNQRSASKSNLVNSIAVLYSVCLHYRYAASLILTSTVPGVTFATIDTGQKRVCPLNDTIFLVFERLLIKGGTSPGSSKIVRDGCKTFYRQCFVLLHHQNCWATSGGTTLTRYLSLAVLNSTGNKFGFTNLRSYWSKSKFYDVFKQDRCPSLDFNRVYIGWCFKVKFWITLLII